jgi:hypothetical protein
MVRTETFRLRLKPEERQHVRALAERAGRTESDLVRLAVLRLSADDVTVGIPSPASPGVKTPVR